MSFAGSSPLNSPSEFTIFHTSAVAVSVASGAALYVGGSGGQEDAGLLASTASGFAVDGSYVAITDFSNTTTPGGLAVCPAFITPDAISAYIALQLIPASPVAGGGSPAFGGTNACIRVYVGSVLTAVPLSITGTFNYLNGTSEPNNTFAIGVNGTIVTAFFNDGVHGWQILGDADCAGLFTTADLETMVAGFFYVNFNAVSGLGDTVSMHSWGPISDFAPVCDPYFANVGLLLHFDGTNGSTSYTDSSSFANTITTHVNGANTGALSTTTPAFGSASLYNPNPGASDSSFVEAAIAGGGPLDITTGDFTLEFWANQIAYGGDPILSITRGTGNPVTQVLLNVTTGGGPSYGFEVWDGAGYQNTSVGVGAPWHAFAIVRSGSSMLIYLDGSLQHTFTGLGAWGSLAGGQIAIGGGYFTNNFNAQSMQGYIDEVRLTKGIARYTGLNYALQVAEFPDIPCNVTVPNVVGLLDAAAQTAITTANLTVGTITTVPNAAPIGIVLSQNPLAGAIAMVNDPVALTESEGLLVPDLTNVALALAEATIIADGFTVGTITEVFDVLVIPGNVISQSPAGGTFADGGSPIALTVSIGRGPVAVPDLIGLTESAAITLLESIGLMPGAIGSEYSTAQPAGLVCAQNPGPGIPVPIFLAYGSIVGFVMSLGQALAGGQFDVEATVISQYANSPTLMQLIQNTAQYLDQTANFENFYNYVWNVDTAVGFGLDILGRIVGVSRLLRIPNTTDYVGFDNSATPPPDWQTMGSDQPPQPAVGGAMYTGYNATQAYLLPDDAYRQLILAKAFANICTTTAPSMNTILQNLYGKGTAWVLNDGVMAISYNLNFTPTAIQLAILEQSGVIPTPPGVSVVINTGV